MNQIVQNPSASRPPHSGAVRPKFVPRRLASTLPSVPIKLLATRPVPSVGPASPTLAATRSMKFHAAPVATEKIIMTASTPNTVFEPNGICDPVAPAASEPWP